MKPFLMLALVAALAVNTANAQEPKKELADSGVPGNPVAGGGVPGNPVAGGGVPGTPVGAGGVPGTPVAGGRVPESPRVVDGAPRPTAPSRPVEPQKRPIDSAKDSKAVVAPQDAVGPCF